MPQIELMMSDLPHTLYKDGKGKVTQKAVDDAMQKMQEAYERKKKRQEAEKERSYTIEEVFAEKADMVKEEQTKR